MRLQSSPDLLPVSVTLHAEPSSTEQQCRLLDGQSDLADTLCRMQPRLPWALLVVAVLHPLNLFLHILSAASRACTIAYMAAAVASRNTTATEGPGQAVEPFSAKGSAHRSVRDRARQEDLSTHRAFNVEMQEDKASVQSEHKASYVPQILRRPLLLTNSAFLLSSSQIPLIHQSASTRSQLQHSSISLFPTLPCLRSPVLDIASSGRCRPSRSSKTTARLRFMYAYKLETFSTECSHGYSVSSRCTSSHGTQE